MSETLEKHRNQNYYMFRHRQKSADIKLEGDVEVAKQSVTIKDEWKKKNTWRYLNAGSILQDQTVKHKETCEPVVEVECAPESPKFSVLTNYNITNQSVYFLCYWLDDINWKLVSLTAVHEELNNGLTNEPTFVDKTEEFVSRVPGLSDEMVQAKCFKIDISRRHVLMNQFSFVLSFMLDPNPSKLFTKTVIIDVPYFETATVLKLEKLKEYTVKVVMFDLFNAKFQMHESLSFNAKALLQKLIQYKRTNSNYDDQAIEMTNFSLNIEDLSQQHELLNYELKNVRFVEKPDVRAPKIKLCSFKVEAKKAPPNIDKLSLCIFPMTSHVEGKLNCAEQCFFAQIEDYDEKTEILRFKAPKDQFSTTSCVRFVQNRITYRACFQAHDMIKENGLQNFFDDFQDEPTLCVKRTGKKFDNFEWFNPQIGTNEEQKTAIKNIVNCTAFPFPYVVFGPPGTGKTSCLVECVAQILKLKPNTKILITTQSNSACDEVGVRLLKHVHRTKIFRFYSQSLLKSDSSKISADLRQLSNLRNNVNKYPTKEELKHFNVIIATLTTCSRLVQMTLHEENLDLKCHFDYIFIDECAAATEPEPMIPIVGLGTQPSEITANIILLGDHKQLGPVIHSDLASRLGLSVSLMERMMSKPRYQMNPTDKSFNANFVTQLLDNYRSHPAILQFSNVLFYDSKLRAKVPEPERSFALQWKYLSKNNFPILFHCCKTNSAKPKKSTSTFNEGEVDKVRLYVDWLLTDGIAGAKVEANDIGIISPYKAQLNKLTERLKDLEEIEIGTAEHYQGREKKIIIISTVKSREGLGFLKDERRLNVCLTRAKSLMIIVGNAETLQQNSLWKSFVHFCKANGGCTGSPFKLKRLSPVQLKIQDKLNSILVNDPGKVAMTSEADTNLHEALIAFHAQILALEDLMNKIKFKLNFDV